MRTSLMLKKKIKTWVKIEEDRLIQMISAFFEKEAQKFGKGPGM